MVALPQGHLQPRLCPRVGVHHRQPKQRPRLSLLQQSTQRDLSMQLPGRKIPGFRRPMASAEEWRPSALSIQSRIGGEGLVALPLEQLRPTLCPRMGSHHQRPRQQRRLSSLQEIVRSRVSLQLVSGQASQLDASVAPHQEHRFGSVHLGPQIGRQGVVGVSRTAGSRMVRQTL